MTEPMTAIDGFDIETEVAHYYVLTEQIEALEAERAAIKTRAADALTPGTYKTSHGLSVQISPPARRFNTDKAWAVLSPEQQAACYSPDPKKIKAQLPQVLIDSLMDAGTGNPVVKIS